MKYQKRWLFLDPNLLLFKQKTVLYVEDDKTTREQTAAILKLMFKEVVSAKSAEEAISLFDCGGIDLVLADIGLPGNDGLHLVKTIREDNYFVPVVMLTSMGGAEQLLQAANLAVDGYIIKPFELNSLINTLSKAIQRGDSNKERIIEFAGNAFFNTSTQEISVDGEVIPLGKKERELLEILVSAHPKTVGICEIENKLWPMEPVGDSALKNLVLRMRKKLGDEIIVSVKAAGYRVVLAKDKKKPSQGALF